MPKKLSPKQIFLLLYISTGALIVIPFLLRVPVLDLFPMFGAPLIIIATFFVIVAIPSVRIALSRLKVPKKYSPKHFLLLVWLTGQAFLLAFLLHGAIYALAIACFGWGFWGQGDEPVFFCIALFVVPAGVVAGAVGRMWEWCVVQPIEEMKAKGVKLPTTWPYFAPFGSYSWLWKFGRGIEAITERRVRVAGVFASVFFLGIIGFVIIRAIIQRRFARVAT